MIASRRFAVLVNGRVVGCANNPVDAQWLAEEWVYERDPRSVQIVDNTCGIVVLDY